MSVSSSPVNLSLFDPEIRLTEMKDSLEHLETVDGLTYRQSLALESLCNRELGESYTTIAERAGVSRTTFWRYMENPVFMAEFQKRVRMEFRGARMMVAHALINSAISGDNGAQKLFWQLSGLLQESIELTGEQRNIERSTIDPETLSPEAREMLLREIGPRLIGSGTTDKED